MKRNSERHGCSRCYRTIREERAALMLSNIMQILDEFVGAAPQHDDITCLIVRRT